MTAYVNGQKIVGVVPEVSNLDLTANTINYNNHNLDITSNTNLNKVITTNNFVTRMSVIENDVANAINLKPESIAYGENVLGVEGNHTEELPNNLIFSRSSVVELPNWVNRLDTSKLNSMEDMFYGCYKLKHAPNWNTSKVEGFSSTFRECSNLVEVPAYNTDIAWVFRNTFCGCSNLIEAPNWNMQKAEFTSSMFNNCVNLKSVFNYNLYTANAHRGDYDNSLKVDTMYENTRIKVKDLIDEEDPVK